MRSGCVESGRGVGDGTDAGPYTLGDPDLRRTQMEIVVRGRNVNVTGSTGTSRKVGETERYLPIIDETRMELSQEGA
jgi:hypothetical protein